MNIQTYIEQIPKAELHLHIEGSFEPELMFEIARRNEIKIPFDSIDEIKAAYSFNNLQEFLDIYYQGAQVLQQEEDFYDLTWAYLEKVNSESVKHVEIMFDPQTHTDRGIAFSTVINGIKRACVDAEEKFGMSYILIMSYLRHLPEASAYNTLEQSIPFQNWITAVGLDSSEVGNPPSKFERVFNSSVEAGYIPLAHAGEEGPPAYIWEALDILNIARIDHGNRSMEDNDLIQYIIKRDMGLTVCPLSNTALQVVDNMQDHPIKKMMDAGLAVTVNSDDPAYFGGYMIDNFMAIQQALDLTKEDIYQLVRNSFNYSLLPQDKKEAYIREVDEFHSINN